MEGCPYDFSFSGLKTSVINTIHNAEQKGVEINKADLGASFMKAVSGCLIKNVEKAMLDTGNKTLVLAGGVSANSVLRADVIELCKKYQTYHTLVLLFSTTQFHFQDFRPIGFVHFE